MKFHSNIHPRPEDDAKPFRAKYNSTCRRCNGLCKIGDLVVYSRSWSMSEHEFYNGVVHITCFPDIENDFYAVRDAVVALYRCLELPFPHIPSNFRIKLIPMYIHQVKRPIVIGMRPNAKHKKIAFDGSVFVSLKTNKQLTIIHKNHTAYTYDPAAKGKVVQFQGHPMLTSSWKPLSTEEARFIWFGTQISETLLQEQIQSLTSPGL